MDKKLNLLVNILTHLDTKIYHMRSKGQKENSKIIKINE